MGLNLGGYVVTRLLASGGMGLVYEATHETIGRRAAVKVLRPEVASDAEWSRRFLTEARAIAAMNHRNIVEILNFGNTPDGRQYMMMAFLEGEALDNYISRNSPVPPALALNIVDQVLNGLAEAHKKGVVHRDLKPSNIVLLREHNGEILVKILDFGLARQDPISLIDATHVTRIGEGTSLLAGTPEYIAPEQAQGKKVDAAADLYSLGVLLFEMLTGELPFSADSVPALLEKHVTEPARRVSSLVSNLPEGLDELVSSLLQKDPEQRPSSADVARQSVQRIIKRIHSDATAVRMNPLHAPSTQKLEPVRPPVTEGADTAEIAPREAPPTDRAVSPPRSRAVGLIAGGVAIAILLVGAAAVLSQQKDPPQKPPEVVVKPAVIAAPDSPAKPDVVAKPEIIAVPDSPAKPDAVAKPEVQPDEPLAALPQLDKHPPKNPTPVKVAKKPPEPVKPVECEPDARWKKNVQATLADLGRRAAESDELYAAFEDAEKPIAKATLAATTRADCAAVEVQLEKLQRTLKR